MLLSKHIIRLKNLEAARMWLNVFRHDSARATRALTLDCGLSIPFEQSTSVRNFRLHFHHTAKTRPMGLRADYDVSTLGKVSLYFAL